MSSDQNESGKPAERVDLRREESQRWIVEPLRRRIAWEGKKVESQMKNLAFALERHLQEMKGEILQAVHQLEESVELMAQELVRAGKRGGKRDNHDADTRGPEATT